MAQLNVSSNILISADPGTVSSNPKKRSVDWTTNFTGIKVKSQESREYTLQPGETKTIYSGVRSLAVDGTTEFELVLNSYSGAGIYRLNSTGGTAPGFRTARAVNIGGETVTVTVNNNATASFALAETSTPTFAAVQVGDIVFIPDTTTGDSASPFGVLNVGFWQVIAVGPSGVGANRKLTCRRVESQPFQATAETVAVASASEFKVFSAAGVQVGDTLVISAGFSLVTQDFYIVTAATDSWLEFASGSYLPLEADILPGALGVIVYSEAKSYLRVEAQQPIVLRFNGDTGNLNTLRPRQNNDAQGVAWDDRWGPVWQLVIVNKSVTDEAIVQVISAIEAQ